MDILLTHGPARGFCDTNSRDGRCGCPELTEAITQRAVPVSVSGHIHSGYGWTTNSDGSTLFINASTCNSSYSPTNPPIVFDAPPAGELHRPKEKGLSELSVPMDHPPGYFQV